MEKRKSVTALLTGFLEEANRNVVKPNYNSNMLMSVTGHTKHNICLNQADSANCSKLQTTEFQLQVTQKEKQKNCKN